MWHRFVKWFALLFKSYTLDEVIEASKEFKAGKDYSFVLHEEPSFWEMNKDLPEAICESSHLFVTLERNGLILTCHVHSRR